MTSPLDGVRVIEFANFAAAPTATAIMADLGADVIKVETLDGDPIRGLMKQAKLPEGEFNPDYPFQFINRGKRSIALNLNESAGVEVAHKLIAHCDVAVLNLLPSRRHRYQLDSETLLQIKPDLVIGLLTGYGEDGEETERPGYDVTAFFSRSGLHGGMIPPGGAPPHARPGQGDHTTSMALFGALMTGLRARDQTGEGQVVEASLLRTAVFTIGIDFASTLIDGRSHVERPREKGLSVMLESFVCSDGRWINFTMPDRGDSWQRFCQAIEREDLLDNESYATGRLRYQNHAELLGIVEETMASKPYDYWTPRLDELRCIWAPLNDAAHAAQDPQVRATGAFETINHPVVGEFETVGAPFRVRTNPEVGARGPAPTVGQHTDEILADLADMSEAEITALVEQGVIGRGPGD